MAPDGTSSPPLTLEEFRPTPGGLLQFLAMLGVVLLAGKAIDAFPLLDPDPPVSFVLSGIVSLVAFAAFARARWKLVPWGSRAPLLMWGGLAAFAILTGFLTWALISFGNGILDRSPAGQVRYTVLGGYKYEGDFFLRVAPESAPGEGGPRGYSVAVTEEDWEAATKGATLLVDLRPGFFGMRWVAGHRLSQTAAGAR